MGYGGLDRELGERLENAGICGKQVRHRAVCVHLYHERGYESAQMWQHNHDIRSETRSLGRVATAHSLFHSPDILPFPGVRTDVETVHGDDRVRKAA
jgi:hypothetical protein